MLIVSPGLVSCHVVQRKLAVVEAMCSEESQVLANQEADFSSWKRLRMCKNLPQKGDSRRQSRKVWKEENARKFGSIQFISFIHSVPSKWYTMCLVLNLYMWRRHRLAPQDILHPFIISYTEAPSEQPLHDFMVDAKTNGTLPRRHCNSLPLPQAYMR